QFGIPGWGNNELQWYTGRPENIAFADGKLQIIARSERIPGANKDYTSARIRTKGRYSFLYGKVEARIKVPGGRGMWPAFWMLPEDDAYGTWAASGEIDILETKNEAYEIHGTTHFGGQWPNNTYNGRTYGPENLPEGQTTFADDFHVYAIEWREDFIRWSVNGEPFFVQPSSVWFSSGAPDNPRAPFDQPFHLLLNLAIGGNFPGTGPDASVTFPKVMEIDWVRVSKRLPQAPVNGVPHELPGDIEAEDFDEGGEGISYEDCDPTNNGAAYRLSDGVDIEESSVFGYNVGWLCPGEWLEYTINASAAGQYEMEALVASDATGGRFQFQIDGAPVSQDIDVPVTFGWQNWETVSGTVDLPAGTSVLRFVNTSTLGQEFNLNRFTFERADAGCSAADIAEPYGILNSSDINAFVNAFVVGLDEGAAGSLADVAPPLGVLNSSDVNTFVNGFVAGCP
ncbi:MAG: carbohydrate-binding protein, partial [Planctomycetota bacterium]